MVDHLNPAARSANMALIRGGDTKPELMVRKVLHALGYRFRLHRRDLPGTPDVVLPRHKVAVFVHGCFWHRHSECKRASTPSSRADFWNKKFARTIERDEAAIRNLVSLGWRPLVLWECELKIPGHIQRSVEQLIAEER